MWHPQRGVLHFARLLAENGPQQTLLSRQLSLAFWRDFADQDVAGLDFSPDANNPVLVEVAKALFPDIGNVAGDLFGTELGVARLHLMLLDVNRGELVLPYQRLAEQDSVLEVAAFPGHKRNQDVLAQRQLTLIGARAVC